MQPIKIMINGMPGNMAQNVAGHAINDSRFETVPYSFTGPDIGDKTCTVNNISFTLIRPENRAEFISQIKDKYQPFITVDYSHPTAVNDNGAFYCRHRLPFVIGTTGGDRELLHRTVLQSDIAAIIAPNMGKQIVGLQAMIEWGAKNLPGLFQGYQLEVRESHQKGKADTSGTAKAIVAGFNQMGVQFDLGEIKMERDPKIQQTVWKVPEEYLTGHAWHTYTLTSDDQTVRFSFTHNVNGREIYSKGTLDAAAFLHKKLDQGAKGVVFSMIDVLRGGMES